MRPDTKDDLLQAATMYWQSPTPESQRLSWMLLFEWSGMYD